MSPLFWPNPFYRCLSTALVGLCLIFSAQAQTTILPTPTSVEYPGILLSLEKLIQIDSKKFQGKNEILNRGDKSIPDLSSVSTIELDPDFLNSIILHSDPSYIKLASQSKCRFYDSLINDLLKNAEGTIRNIFITYLDKDKNINSSIVTKRDFINSVARLECPETAKLIDQFQIKNLDQTIKSSNFTPPTGTDQCHNIYMDWLNEPKAPYFCKLHEFIKEANNGNGDPKDLPQRRAMAEVIEKKLNPSRRDYLENLCENFEDEELFCNDFLNVSFWTKIANGFEDKIYVEDICTNTQNSSNLNPASVKQCLSKIKRENDLCLYPSGNNVGLVPQPQCDTLATALNYSSLRSDYKDCPRTSDQQAITNMGRILLNMTKEKIAPWNGQCSSISTGATLAFNKAFDNDENWKLEACYDDKITEQEVCTKTFFGNYGDLSESYNVVVANILRKTRGAETSLRCEMVNSTEYNPLLLQYKSGCFIVYESSQCFISQCKHKILYNDRIIDFIKIKNRAYLEYFPTNVNDERFSQQYMLTHDFKRNGKSLKNVSSIVSFFKKYKNGIIHGVGCAEDLLPSFFKKQAFNQCTALPFIIDGMIREKDRTILVTRTAADSLQAPRLISWSLIYSAVKSYQHSQPLKLWTLYGLD